MKGKKIELKSIVRVFFLFVYVSFMFRFLSCFFVSTGAGRNTEKFEVSFHCCKEIFENERRESQPVFFAHALEEKENGKKKDWEKKEKEIHLLWKDFFLVCETFFPSCWPRNKRKFRKDKNENFFFGLMIPCIFLSFFKSRFSVNSFLPVKVLHFKTLFFSFRQKKMKNFWTGKEKEKRQAQKRKSGKRFFLFVCTSSFTIPCLLYLLSSFFNLV